nr:unnamed protein product [Callosobruchus chinensis]
MFCTTKFLTKSITFPFSRRKRTNVSSAFLTKTQVKLIKPQ